jgi:pyruvate/2-oxoglutarate dehydrogenase complex dihydrolipoamide dehydrogenase (E3) component
MSDESYDLVVVGAGQGGVPLAVNLAEEGWRVALVEREHLGGTCVNVGCTPTKTMVASARAAHVARSSGDLGVRAADVEVDFPAVVERKDGIVQSFREGLGKRVDRDGLTLVRGDARFREPGVLEVRPAGEGDHDGHGDGADRAADGDPRILRFDRVVLDVGARPSVPPVPGLDEAPWVDSTGVMELEELPEHLAVMGGGYVGCEFAQMFRRFGSRVSVLELGDQLLPREDPEIAEAVADAFREEGIDVRLGAGVSGVEPNGSSGVRLEIGGGPDGDGSGAGLEADVLLVATGRRPNTDGLGLEAAGIEADDSGHVPVDETFATGTEGVWAIGDVNDRGAPFTNVSYDDFRILYENWVHDAGLSAEGRNVTYAVFVDPPVAGVGMNEREATEAGVDHVVATTPMSHVARGIETGETQGLMKMLVDPESREILGFSMVGLAADEVAHVVTAAMDAGGTVDDLASGVYAHPAVAEALPVLARKLEKEGGYA